MRKAVEGNAAMGVNEPTTGEAEENLGEQPHGDDKEATRGGRMKQESAGGTEANHVQHQKQ